MACSVKAELEAQVVAEQEKHKDTHDKYERAACAEHSHTSPHTWEQFWIVRALRHGYESFGLCCVHRRSMERCWLPRRTAGRSRRIRSRSSETTSRSQSAEPLCPPHVPSYSHAYPQQPQPEHRFEARRRDLSGMARMQRAAPPQSQCVRACAHCTASQAPAVERAMCKESAALQASASMQLARVASVSARGRFGSAVPHGRLANLFWCGRALALILAQ